MSGQDILKALFAEAIEGITEAALLKGVVELQEEYDELTDNKIDEWILDILGDIIDDREDELALYGGAISAAVKPFLKEAVKQGANMLIAYLWEQAQKINKYDAETPAPAIQ